MSMDAFLKAAGAALGAEYVNTAAETLTRYGENTMPAGDRRPAAVLYPGSTGEVAALVRLANEYRAPLFPTSTGNNMGLGTRSAPAAGMAVLDLGRRMNRILEIDEKLGFAAVEPGVSFQMLADELKRRGGQWMNSTTSGPPQGGMIGNALDKGAGYGPYFDHFGFSCGMEVVLGTGDVIRTGDGSIGGDTLVNWHVSKLFLRTDPGRAVRAIELRHRDPAGGLAIAAAAGDPLLPLRLPGRRRSGRDRRVVPADEDVELRADTVPGRQRPVSDRQRGIEPGLRRLRRAGIDWRRCAQSPAESARAGRVDRLRRLLRPVDGGDGTADPARGSTISALPARRPASPTRRRWRSRRSNALSPPSPASRRIRNSAC